MKNIKTTKTIILVALVIASSLFTSCSKDDDNKETSIVGSWKIVSSIEEKFVNNVSEGKTSNTIDDKNYEIFTFNTNGTFTDYEVNENENGPLTDTGIYKINSNKLLLNWEGDSVSDTEEYEFTLSANKLIIVFNEENASINTKYIVTTTLIRQ